MVVYALAFKRLRQEDQKFEVSLGYTLSLRPSWARGDLASEITPLSPDSYLCCGQHPLTFPFTCRFRKAQEKAQRGEQY